MNKSTNGNYRGYRASLPIALVYLVDSSSRKGDMQGTDNDIAGSPNGMFTIDATADDIVEDIQEEGKSCRLW